MRRALLLIAVTLAVAGGVPAQKKIVSGLEKAFRPARDVADVLEVRRAALKAARGNGQPKLVDALLDALAQTEREVVEIEEARRDYLGTHNVDKRLQSRRVLDPLIALQDDLIAALRDVRGAAATRVVSAGLKRRRLPFTARVLFARQAPWVGTAELAPALEKALLRSKDAAAIVVALTAIEKLGTEAASFTPRVLSRLDHPDAVVRETAAAALSTLARPEGVEPLIRRLDKDTGVTKERIARALEVLTRRPLGTSARAWKRFWDREGADVLAERIPLGGGTPSGARADSTGSYHGIPLTGESILYVFDRSLSMRQSMARSGKRAEPGEESRLARAVKELSDSLGALPPRKRFNIVIFAARCERFADTMQPATPGNVKLARTWLRKIKLEFATSIYDGLDLAFAIAGRRPGDRLYTSSVDTVFLMTDGRPTVPRPGSQGLPNDRWPLIHAAVDRWNLFDRVVVHAIGLGAGLPARPMRRLAERNGGRFVHER